MADPTFRSLNQIIGEMVTTFLSELDSRGIAPGIKSLKPGSPYLAIFEAVAQSQFRNQEQTLSLLDANDLDLAKGDRLDRLGASEKLPRRGATFAAGKVTISDTSFTARSTKVYQGQPAPISGSNTLYLADATSWPTSGSIYIGRGTSNLEGPLAYTALVNSGAYWTLTLTTQTASFHGLGEGVTLARGGDRVIPAGQGLSTPTGSSSGGVSYLTTQEATLLDGEAAVTDVPVVCQLPGEQGNVAREGISVVVSPAFIGMAVANPSPFSNGLPVEDDDHYRDRIRQKRFSPQSGTRVSIEAAAYGVNALDEASTVTSATYVQRSTLPSLLVIDDGTGYEERDAGVATEVLADAAVGGENVFYLTHGRPVAKASVITALTAPFGLQDRAVLSFSTATIPFSHQFLAGQFRNIAAATAYEVASSINQNAQLPISARTVGGGRSVAIYAKADTNDDLQVLPGGANDALGFPAARVETLRLYKNDRLLSKDGLPAFIASKPQSSWGPLSSGDTLTLAVDGTPAQTFVFTDADFAALGQGIISLSASLPLSAWAAVFNAKLPGISTTISGNSLLLTSKQGSGSLASVEIDAASSLVSKGAFDPASLVSYGRARDYVLDRNLGQVELLSPLVAGDRLVAGSPFTRAYLESGDITSGVNVPADGANLWFAVDGSPVRIDHSLTGLNTIRLSWQVANPIRTIQARTATSIAPGAFSSVARGDWAIFTLDPWWGDLDLHPVHFGAFRVAGVSTDGSEIYVEAPVNASELQVGLTSGYNDSAYAFGSIVIVRSAAAVQKVTVAGPVLLQPSQVVTSLASLRGATASLKGTSKLRITTHTYGTEGDIALVACDLFGSRFLLPVSDAIHNNDSHIASAESGNSDVGTVRPSSTDTVTGYQVASGAPRIQGTLLSNGWLTGLANGAFFMRPSPKVASPSRYGTNSGEVSDVLGYDPSGAWYRLDHLLAPPVVSGYTDVNPDRIAIVGRFAFGAESYLNVVLDDDAVSKSYSVPMFRRVRADSSVPYGQSLRLLDSDNSNQSLSKVFGTSFDFSNYVLYGHARAILNPTTPANTRTLWRTTAWTDNSSSNGQVGYFAPLAPSSSVSVLHVAPDGNPRIILASGTAKVVTLDAAEKLRYSQASTTETYASAFAIASIARTSSTVTVTVTLPGDITDHGFVNGNDIVVTTAHADFPSGTKNITRINATQFSYTESGTALTVTTPAAAFVAWSANPVSFANVVVGDYVSILSGYSFTPTSADSWPSAGRQSRRVSGGGSAGPYWFRTRSVATPAAAWVTVSDPTDFKFFPLTSNTATQVIAAVNALSNAGIKGTSLDTGAGSITLDAGEAPSEAAATLSGSFLQIASATYHTGDQTYDFVLKLAPTAIATPHDWANEYFRLVPTTAKNVAAYLNAGNVTGLASAGVSIETANRAGRIQVVSGTQGSGGSVKVAGGTANALRFPVIASNTFDGAHLVAQVKTNADINATSVRMMVAVDNSTVLPKVTDWTASSTLEVADGVATVGVAGHAWTYANSGTAPTFGARWLVEKVGNLTAYTLADQGGIASYVRPLAGDWVHIESGIGSWENVGNAHSAIGSTATRLLDGRVLVVGGTNQYSLGASQTTSGNSSAYDPSTNTWASAGSLGTSRAWHTATLLPDGKVLIAGGINASTSVPTYLGSCEIFDPTTNAFTTTASLTAARSHHTATLLGNGTVFVCGGYNGTSHLGSYQVYSPTDASWASPAGSMGVARSSHMAIAYGDNQVLVGGGATVGGTAPAYEAYRTAANAWTSFTVSTTRRVAGRIIPLGGDRFMCIGGVKTNAVNPASWVIGETLRTSEIIDATQDAAVPGPVMRVPRAAFGMAALADGRFLALGGISEAGASFGATRSAEVLDIASQTWSWGVGGFYAHAFSEAVLLESGKVLAPANATDAGLPNSAASEIFDPTAHSGSAGNAGIFRVALAESVSGAPRFWIENAGSVAEEAGFGILAAYTYDSVVPGDYLNISASTFGDSNVGRYAVTGLDITDRAKFLVSGVAFSPTVLGSDVAFVKVVPPAPTRAFYEVAAIYPTDNPTGLTNFALTPVVQPELVSPACGSVLTFLDRLAFPTDVKVGQDGYRYSTGLIGEVNKVIFGDERDTSTYPGVAAAGAAINVSAPLIRRVSVAVAVRVTPGALDVRSRVQSAIAKTVNSARPGAIPISDLVAAVEAVQGVVSVVMLSPVSTTANDSIPVQPGEKAMVIDIDSDIQVSFIGQ